MEIVKWHNTLEQALDKVQCTQLHLLFINQITHHETCKPIGISSDGWTGILMTLLSHTVFSFLLRLKLRLKWVLI